MNEYHDNNSQNIVGIKAGSSIFQNYECFPAVADMIAALVQPERQIYFVVSAVKEQTNRVITAIAEQEAYDEADPLVSDSTYRSFRQELSDALTGNLRQYTGRFNKSKIAGKLVQPEMVSVEHLVHALRKKGIDAKGIEHGYHYPIIGMNNNEFLYATLDLDASRRSIRKYDASVVVVPGFGLRSERGEIMCTGRNSSDWTLAQFGALCGMGEIVYWKDSEGYLKDPKHPELGVYDTIAREVVKREGAKVLDSRVLDTFTSPIRITGKGQLTGGTVILPYQNAGIEEAVQNVAAK